MSTPAKTPQLRTFVVFAIVAITAAILARGFAIWTLRGDAIDDAARDVGHVATILAAQTAQSIKAIDESLGGLRQHLIALQQGSPDNFAAAIRSADIQQALNDRIARLPQTAAIAIAGPEGHIINHSNSWPVQNADGFERDIAASYETGGLSDLHVTPPLSSPVENAKILFFSRRVQSRHGEFIGLVVIGIQIDYLKRIYNDIGSMANVSFTLVRSDGSILLSYPDAADRVGEKMPAQSPWYAAVAQGAGYYRSPGDLGDEARFIAVRAVPDYPLVVNAAEPESVTLAPWQRVAAFVGIGTAVTLICFLFLLRILYVQFGNLSASQISLAERENELGKRSQELARANTQLDAALNNMSQGLCMFDKAGRLAICNERYLRLYEMSPDAIKPGKSFVDVLKYRQRVGNFSGDPERFAETLRARLAQGQLIHTTSQLASGRVIEVANEPMDGGGWVETHDDITERQRNEARIAHMARYDALTDLANRVLFRETADEALERYKSTGIGYSIFVFDLDLFKSVNDSLGHPVGDALLKAVAKRLQSMIREIDTVGRIGGDEFAILHIAEDDQRQAATDLASHLLEVVGAPYEIDGHRIVIGTSIGIAMAPQHGLDNEKLLKNADLALYRAKSDGRNSYRFFEPDMDRELRLRRALEVGLQSAVANGEFEAYYQSLVNADDGMICAIEALIRWRHPQQGLVTPVHFIPVAEERGMISAIDRWMLHRACCDAMEWPDHIRVAVNLSPMEFRSGDVLEMIAGALALSGLAASRLELEITESVLLQKSAGNISILHQIKNLGVSIVLDDFGTGYSSLGYLRLFPFDKIKIDKSFVREMTYRSDCAAIVSAIASLGRELNMITVAEGVETREQLELVRAAGCKQVQGFLFSRPGPASQLAFSRAEVVELRRAASA
jgi:diguanylate cyclase (GGDEF)-like protein